MKILAINAGSSSVKSSLFDLNDSTTVEAVPPLWEANLDVKHGKMQIDIGKDTFDRALKDDEKANPFAGMLNALWQGHGAVLSGPQEVKAVGHRIVHGGPVYHESVVVDQRVKDGIRDLFEFAPLHNPANLRGIEWAEKVFGPSVPQIAVFDTGFHHNLPPEASTYALPFELCRRYHIRRYGFHGISHQYCANRAARMLKRDPANFKVIVCHLGNGCSLAAVKDGTSIDTTMGFTPLDGLVMGTRSGAIDPGILVYLMEKEAHSHDQLDELLDRKSGLLGISGTTSDMREILEARGKGDKRAALAFDVFVHSLAGYIGAMLARLNGADALVFTGGIGEHAAAVRAAACNSFSFAGIEIDAEAANKSSVDDSIISTDHSTIAVLVIHTRENWVIAKEAQRLI
jgi:acetate kinase